jgi:hypothetical protein
VGIGFNSFKVMVFKPEKLPDADEHHLDREGGVDEQQCVVCIEER